jgi:hypothetical protein
VFKFALEQPKAIWFLFTWQLCSSDFKILEMALAIGHIKTLHPKMGYKNKSFSRIAALILNKFSATIFLCRDTIDLVNFVKLIRLCVLFIYYCFNKKGKLFIISKIQNCHTLDC